MMKVIHIRLALLYSCAVPSNHKKNTAILGRIFLCQEFFMSDTPALNVEGLACDFSRNSFAFATAACRGRISGAAARELQIAV